MTSKSGHIPRGDSPLPWFVEPPKSLPNSGTELLKSYSDIPANEVVPHIMNIREKAYRVFPYPCVGQFRFLDLSIRRLGQYQEMVDRVKAGQTLLDAGCCFGQDVRALVADGAPSSPIVGTDLYAGFLELGYELFRDRDTLRSKFIAADILDPNSALKDYTESFDMISASALFPLFDWDEQVDLGKALISLLRPTPESMIVGTQNGNIDPNDPKNRELIGKMIRHDEDSFRRLWSEVAQQTGTEWDVTVEHVEDVFGAEGGCGWTLDSTIRLHFCMRRI